MDSDILAQFVLSLFKQAWMMSPLTWCINTYLSIALFVNIYTYIYDFSRGLLCEFKKRTIGEGNRFASRISSHQTHKEVANFTLTKHHLLTAGKSESVRNEGPLCGSDSAGKTLHSSLMDNIPSVPCGLGHKDLGSEIDLTPSYHSGDAPRNNPRKQQDQRQIPIYQQITRAVSLTCFSVHHRPSDLLLPDQKWFSFHSCSALCDVSPDRSQGRPPPVAAWRPVSVCTGRQRS